jgi:hypothetical protein
MRCQFTPITERLVHNERDYEKRTSTLPGETKKEEGNMVGLWEHYVSIILRFT